MKITIDTNEEVKLVISKPVDEWSENDKNVLEKAKRSLPRKTVKLPKDEAMIHPGQNAKNLIHTVKKGETLSSICKMYSVSYGELSNHLMNSQGTTSIYKGMDIEIPRHFIDLTEAI